MNNAQSLARSLLRIEPWSMGALFGLILGLKVILERKLNSNQYAVDTFACDFNTY